MPTLQAPPAQTQIWTYDEVNAHFPEGTLVELLDGELFEMPSPILQHQTIVLKMALFLTRWKEQHGGELFLSPVDLYVNQTKYFIPDLAFYFQNSLDTKPVLADPKRLTVAPDLIIEVVSPSSARQDRVVKIREYAAFRVENYWLIDPDEQTLHAYSLREDGYFLGEVGAGTETFSPAIFPGFVLELETLWAP